MQSNLSSLQSLPGWLPDAVRLYLDHTEDGQSYRALARRDGRHASTVMRAVRRYETRRDDPLLDEALSALANGAEPRFSSINKDVDTMTAPVRPNTIVADDATITAEGKRILRRLVEPGAMLAFAPDMEKAVVMREFPDGHSARTAVVERVIAQAFALKDWISCRKPGRVATYEISSVGRAALKRMIDAEARTQGFAEAQTGFDGPGGAWEGAAVADDAGPRRIRYNLAESPVAVLGRRRDKDGKLYLEPELVGAAERLREDFELAQMGPRVTQNWERFLTGTDRGATRAEAGIPEGPRAARDRVAAALRDLGPGLGDVALRVCCFLEGIETAEQRLGWAARSGKVVLRIALQRLLRHYDETYGRSGPLIG
ncbi:MAG: helix-turn-helix domain containing protein [Pseudorhodobacter sp. PARRP1]|nr:MAG: helix-turn-helix domain containing protein [Pseudorhodobacter sp. PARRP1]